MTPFKDHFSTQAATYASFRPDYPPKLFEYVASLVTRHEAVWDCGTGSGQAAVPLAEYFTRVIATDLSAAQLAHARPHPRVTYHAAPAESSGLRDRSVDVVTVAQALHWFDLPRFYAEVRRVTVPDGALAVWAYDDLEMDESALQGLLDRFSHETLGPYWPPERQLVWDRYRTIDFPFAEIPTPIFTIERAWTLPELAGYLRSWSSVTRFIKMHGVDPVDTLLPALATEWGDPAQRRRVVWPVTMRAGRITG